MKRTDYFREYKRAYRKNKAMTKKSFKIKDFELLDIGKFKDIFETKIDGIEKEVIYRNIINIMQNINICNECLKSKGLFIEMETGQLKTNPAQKELRENIKILNKLLNELKEDKNLEAETLLNTWLED